MTKDQAKEFLVRNPQAYAHHPSGDIFVASNIVRAHDIVNNFQRPPGQPHEQWLDDAFEPWMPKDGWHIGVSARHA